MRITSAFDAGNIEVIDAENPSDVRLRIRRDAGGRFMQWFYFRASGVKGVPLTLVIENAHEAAYAAGWQGYRACASSDREGWVRVPTEYDGRALTIRHTPEHDVVWYAYFAPYSLERHADLVARSQQRARVDVLGLSADGREIERIRAGSGPRTIWMIARQHPGETMAEWFVDGFLSRLLDPSDPVTPSLLAQATFHVVPNMNPDGSYRGHLRTNARGVNLNRAWLDPSETESPEVWLARSAMHRSGVDLCVDVHGDEELPYNFVVGPDGVPALTKRQSEIVAELKRAWAELDPDFQTQHGYPAPGPGQADLRLCTNYVAQTFGCPAITIEQPFKDTANRPSPATGWSDLRARRFGAGFADVIARVIELLRA
jgi:murein tripeptide amidase MpaA